ncbi:MULTISPECIES: CsxC family protein [Brevibacillus]|uniref:DUF7852 domain-containing protein n=1 Tax=Brevibacillus brevis TaxID=1393 RepID=A0A2Z4MIL0_BREBE|nr:MULTISPECIES: hypothetical protein [Brevibacillus]AWX56352.1 hypothetical protein AB432_015480 [Brevibacillus brevis]NRR23083.1 hypothetical protein [Brevibacillus sp. MS2.2]RAT93967.1 hypothetical protein ASG16_027710 [Brevibacillus sp. Leaf182]
MGIHGDGCNCGQTQVTQNSCTVENARVFGMASTETAFPKTIKVPVTLAETAVVVCVEANVHLERPALEIIRVLKSVILEQCELVPTFNPLSAKLFVSGFIRKNIEYTTVDQVTGTAVCGDVRHTTALIPFDFCTDLTFPATGPTLQLAPDFESHGEYLNKSGHAAKINVGLFGNRKVYNERPYCELLFTEFTELDIGLENKRCKDTTKTFSTVREKIVLRIGLKVLQDQQVPIPTTPPPTPPPKPTFPPPCKPICPPKKKW